MKHFFPILITLFTLSSMGLAQDVDRPERPDFPQKHKMAQQMRLEMLDLSDEQREAIEDTKFDAQKKIIPLRADIELRRLDLHKEMQSDDPNRNKIMKIVKEISDLELKIKQTEINKRLDIHSILTPEQREELKRPKRTIIKEKKIERHFED